MQTSAILNFREFILIRIMYLSAEDVFNFFSLSLSLYNIIDYVVFKYRTQRENHQKTIC
jgi:hypothetical protein